MSLVTSLNKTIRGNVLVVDDRSSNRELLLDLLEADGHTVFEAASGEEALSIIKEQSIDTVLLDVMMPGMDGFTVCQTIKQDPDNEHIHVILVTALDERDYQIKGLAWGADDYFTKPIDAKLLRLRVRNAVKMKMLHDKIEMQFKELVNLEESRDNLVHMLIHDMRGLLSGVVGGVDYLKFLSGENMDPDQVEVIECIDDGANRLADMIGDILDVSRSESTGITAECESFSVTQSIEEVVSTYSCVQYADIKFEANNDDSTKVDCDPQLFRRILDNLVGNALKHTPKTKSINIAISTERDSMVRVSVKDQGDGIPDDMIDHIFTKWGQVDSSKPKSSGIGLTFCKMATEAMGGSIGVNSEVGKGSEFWFEVPLFQPSPLPLAR